MPRVLVTGASGFVARALCPMLNVSGWDVRAATRTAASVLPSVERVVVGDVGPGTEWHEALTGVDCVVHLAARVHVMRDRSLDPLADFRRVNVEGTQNLVRQAAQAGVRRLVLLSSAKVHGESTSGRAFTADDFPAPVGGYALSKLEAEQVLWEETRGRALEGVVVRPPLVYGPGAGGNFARLLELVRCGVPLPLGRVNNRRSLVSVGNLVDFLRVALEHPDAAGHAFLVADRETTSTAELVRSMAEACGRRPNLLPVPLSVLRVGAAMCGAADIYHRLCDSLELDIAPTTQHLGWLAPQRRQEALAEACRA